VHCVLRVLSHLPEELVELVESSIDVVLVQVSLVDHLREGEQDSCRGFEDFRERGFVEADDRSGSRELLLALWEDVAVRQASVEVEAPRVLLAEVLGCEVHQPALELDRAYLVFLEDVTGLEGVPDQFVVEERAVDVELGGFVVFVVNHEAFESVFDFGCVLEKVSLWVVLEGNLVVVPLLLHEVGPQGPHVVGQAVVAAPFVELCCRHLDPGPLGWVESVFCAAL